MVSSRKVYGGTSKFNGAGTDWNTRPAISVKGLTALDRVAPLGPFPRRKRQRIVQDRRQHVDKGDVGNSPGPQLWCHVQRGTNQQPACRAALNDDPPPVRVAISDQRMRDGDEVVEGIRFAAELRCLVPVAAQLLSSPDVGDGVDKAAVHQRQAAGGKGRGHAGPVGPITIQQAGRGAIQRRILVI